MTGLTISAHLKVQHGPTEFFAHVITVINRTDYRADGFSIISDGSNSNEEIQIDVYIKESPTIPDFPLENPIVHTFSLGGLPPEQNRLQINIIDRNRGKIGDTIINTADADEVIRPVHI